MVQSFKVLLECFSSPLFTKRRCLDSFGSASCVQDLLTYCLLVFRLITRHIEHEWRGLGRREGLTVHRHLEGSFWLCVGSDASGRLVSFPAMSLTDAHARSAIHASQDSASWDVLAWIEVRRLWSYSHAAVDSRVCLFREVWLAIGEVRVDLLFEA